MLTLSELKIGDVVRADFEGQFRVGEVEEINAGSHQALVHHGENDLWYNIRDLYAVPVNEEHLAEFGFLKTADGRKWEKGPFSLTIVPDEANGAILHYRDETRYVHDLRFMHQLQNHYHAMTNFVLNR